MPLLKPSTKGKTEERKSPRLHGPVSEQLSNESVTEENDEGAQLVESQSAMLAAMKSMIEEANKKQNSDMMEIISQAVTQAVAPFQEEIASLKAKLNEKEVETSNLSKRLEELEQNSRLNSLRIEGMPETKDENTDEQVIQLARETLGVELKPEDIDYSYRIGKAIQNTDQLKKSRPIIVKFSSYNACRKVYKCKVKLRNIKDKKIYINEDLTKTRLELSYQARQLVKKGKYKNTWTADGKVFLLKGENERPKMITTKEDLDKLV